MVRLHERTLPVQKMTNELSTLVLDYLKDKDLTDVEYLQWLASEQQSVLKWMLREERHGDDNYPAEWAKE